MSLGVGEGASGCARKMDVVSASGCVRTPSTVGGVSEGAWLPPGVWCVPKGPQRGLLPACSRPESPGLKGEGNQEKASSISHAAAYPVTKDPS